MSYEIITSTSTVYKCVCQAKSKEGIECGYKWNCAKLPKRCPQCKRRTWNNGDRRYRGTVLTFKGETKTVRQWAADLGINVTTIQQRIHRGWNIEDCLDPAKFVAGRRPKSEQ